VKGIGPDGLPFKKENINSILVGIPPALSQQPLRAHDRVRLRGELWGPPTFNDKSEPRDDVLFALREVL
jgi:hypothetical protein